MLWHGRLHGCGSWLPENKKLTCGMEEKTVVSYGCQKTKNKHCGMEEKTVEAHGPLPSPAPRPQRKILIKNCVFLP